MACRLTEHAKYKIIVLVLLATQSLASDDQKEDIGVGPWRPIPTINWCGPVKQCPLRSGTKRWREQCIGTSQEDDMAYHCQFNSALNVSLEFLYPRHKCGKGTHGLVEYNNTTRSVRIICRNCSDDSFQTEAHYSPDNLKGCTHQRKSHDPTKVTCEDAAGPIEADRCYCNYLESWFSRSGVLFCGFTDPCDCINNFRCNTDQQDLLPDGRCYPRCEGVRRADRNFDCLVTQTQGQTTAQSIDLAIKEPTSEKDVTTVSKREYNTIEATSSGEAILTVDIILPVVICVVIFILVILVVLCVVLRRRRSCISSHKNISKAGRDLIQIKKADHVNVTVHYSSCSSQSDDCKTEESIVSEELAEENILLGDK